MSYYADGRKSGAGLETNTERFHNELGIRLKSLVI